MKNKICSQCNEEKPLRDFPKVYSKRKNGTPVGDGRRANCRVCENKRRKYTYDNNPISRMIMNAKSRSRQYKIPFTITLKDVPIPEKCPILEVLLVLGSAENYEFAPSIDRIDSTRGYIPGNVKVVSLLANRMKSNATKEQCLLFAKNIANYLKDDIV
jgi:hypothetical protein